MGAYVGNDAAASQRFESWLGHGQDIIPAYGGFEALPGQNSGWVNFDSSVNYQLNLWKGMDRPVLWSIPLLAKDATMADAAAGRYDEHYRIWARALAKNRSEQTLYIRTGWEFNGGWFPWTVTGGRSQQFISAYRHFVDAFRSVDPTRFRFEWNVNIGAQDGNNPEDAYPGDDYVDVIGMDFYRQGWPADPVEAWNWNVTQKYGLQWHQDFAAKHHKQTAYSEWGVNSNTDGPYIRKAAEWFRQHHVLYQIYWDSNAAYPGKLSTGQYPAAAGAYREEFQS